MDPAFQQFVLVKIPLGVTLGMGVADALLLHFILRSGHLHFRRILWLMLRANLVAILVNIALLALIMFAATGEMLSYQYMLTILFAVGYFACAFAGLAWWKKVKVLQKEIAQGRRLAKAILAITTLAGYGTLYWIIYQKMFAYPG